MIAELAGAGLATAAATLAIGAYAPNSRVFGVVIARGPSRLPWLYLTFDDGPNPTATHRVLETLGRHGVLAAFFLVGDHVRRYPELAREVQSAGHVIGNHTDSHATLHLKGPRRIAEELGRAHETIADVVGTPPRLFRAPHGYRNPFVTLAARRLGYRVVGWTFGVWDSARPGAERIQQRVAAKLEPGAIVLLHDGDGDDPRGDRSQTANALDGIIRDARARGFSFRALGDLLAL